MTSGKRLSVMVFPVSSRARPFSFSSSGKLIVTTRDRATYDADGAGARDAPSRKRAAEDKADFSGMDSFTGNGVCVISPAQLDKSAASMLIPVMADRVLMQTSVVIFSRVRAGSRSRQE